MASVLGSFRTLSIQSKQSDDLAEMTFRAEARNPTAIIPPKAAPGQNYKVLARKGLACVPQYSKCGSANRANFCRFPFP
jgi:hypothetical protein